MGDGLGANDIAKRRGIDRAGVYRVLGANSVRRPAAA
jgi:hypothetical protein